MPHVVHHFRHLCLQCCIKAFPVLLQQHVPADHAHALFVLQEERPGFLTLVQDMLKPESLPPGWTASFDAAAGRRCEARRAGRMETQRNAWKQQWSRCRCCAANVRGRWSIMVLVCASSISQATCASASHAAMQPGHRSRFCVQNNQQVPPGLVSPSRALVQQGCALGMPSHPGMHAPCPCAAANR